MSEKQPPAWAQEEEGSPGLECQGHAPAEETPEEDATQMIESQDLRDLSELGGIDSGESPETALLPEETHDRVPRLTGVVKGRKISRKLPNPMGNPDARERIIILDTWQKSGLGAEEFARLINFSKHTLYTWKKKFEAEGPAGLMDKPRGGPRGSRLPEVTKRAILMLKRSHPDYGCQRISDLLARGPALPAGAGAVARVLHEAGYEVEMVETHPHPPKVMRFERARPNQLWQTDLFTFTLKRQNRRVYLIVFMDDASRFIVGHGLYASAVTAMVIEVLRKAIADHGLPEELLSDNGPQYVTWRGKSAFSRELEKQGIKHIVATPRRPQTLGKVERFWGTLWREWLEAAIFADMEDAQARIRHFIDHYNFQRPHQGIEGLVPGDRFFHAAPEVLSTLKARIEANALELARGGIPKDPFYMTGQVGGKAFSVHAEGEKIIMTGKDGDRKEVTLSPEPIVIPEKEKAIGEGGAS